MNQANAIKGKQAMSGWPIIVILIGAIFGMIGFVVNRIDRDIADVERHVARVEAQQLVNMATFIEKVAKLERDCAK